MGLDGEPPPRALHNLWVSHAPFFYTASAQTAQAAWPILFHQMEKKKPTEGFEFNLRLLAGFHLPITCCCQQRFPPPVISFHGCASQPTGWPPGALLRRRIWEFVNIMGSFFLPTAEVHYTLYNYISTAHVLL